MLLVRGWPSRSRQGRISRVISFSQGYPLFDQPEQPLKIMNFDFAVDAGSMLVNRGDDVLRSRLREIVAAKLDLGHDTRIRKIPMIATDVVANAKCGRTIAPGMSDVEVNKCEKRMGKQKNHFSLTRKPGLHKGLKKIISG
jgi:hypothetical protein